MSLVEESSGTPSSVCRVINQGLFELSVTPITFGPYPTLVRMPPDSSVAHYLKSIEAAEESQERSALEEDRLVICTIAPGESRTINITFNYEVLSKRLTSPHSSTSLGSALAITHHASAPHH